MCRWDCAAAAAAAGEDGEGDATGTVELGVLLSGAVEDRLAVALGIGCAGRCWVSSSMSTIALFP